MLHRSSRRIIATARSNGSNRLGGNEHTVTPSSRAGLMPHYLVGKTYESKAPLRVRKRENPSAVSEVNAISKTMKTSTSELADVGAARIPAWGPRDPSKRRVETVGDMDQRRSQWIFASEIFSLWYSCWNSHFAVDHLTFPVLSSVWADGVVESATKIRVSWYKINTCPSWTQLYSFASRSSLLVTLELILNRRFLTLKLLIWPSHPTLAIVRKHWLSNTSERRQSSARKLRVFDQRIKIHSQGATLHESAHADSYDPLTGYATLHSIFSLQ